MKKDRSRRATVVCKQSGCILLVRRSGGRWVLPGGTVEVDEKEQVAATRELWEEARLQADPQFQFEYASKRRTHFVYECEVEAGQTACASNEIAQCRWVLLAQLDKQLDKLEVSETTKDILRLLLHPVQALAA